jgi:protein phosphatase
MVESGHLSPQDATHHRLRHVITNALGSAEPGVTPEVHKLRLEPADLLLLCTDGLTEMVSSEEIAELLHQEPDVLLVCERLVVLANEKGGKDNITVVLARFSDGTPSR